MLPRDALNVLRSDSFGFDVGEFLHGVMQQVSEHHAVGQDPLAPGIVPLDECLFIGFQGDFVWIKCASVGRISHRSPQVLENQV